MSDDPDDGGDDWRIQRKNLEPFQIEALEQLELQLRSQGRSAGQVRQKTMQTAREFVNSNLGSIAFAGIELPTGFGTAADPRYDTETSRWQREFSGPLEAVGGIKMKAMGTQVDDGTVVTCKLLIQGYDELPVAEARQLAASLLNLADYLESLT